MYATIAYVPSELPPPITAQSLLLMGRDVTSERFGYFDLMFLRVGSGAFFDEVEVASNYQFFNAGLRQVPAGLCSTSGVCAIPSCVNGACQGVPRARNDPCLANEDCDVLDSCIAGVCLLRSIQHGPCGMLRMQHMLT